MNDVLTSLVSAVAYGGIGAFFGFLVGVTVADRHRVHEAVLTGEADDMPEARGLLRPDRVQRYVVILVMLALLLAGLGWIQASRQARAREERNCAVLHDMLDVLHDRSLANEDQASANRQVWTDLRVIIKRGGQHDPGTVAVLKSIDRYLASQDATARKVNAHPFPTLPEQCTPQ